MQRAGEIVRQPEGDRFTVNHFKTSKSDPSSGTETNENEKSANSKWRNTTTDHVDYAETERDRQGNIS